MPREAQLIGPAASAALPNGRPGMLCQAKTKSGAISANFAIGDHRRGADAVFLRRLEQQHGAAPLRAGARKTQGEREEGRGMAVVAAKVSLTGNFRAMRRVAKLLRSAAHRVRRGTSGSDPAPRLHRSPRVHGRQDSSIRRSGGALARNDSAALAVSPSSPESSGRSWRRRRNATRFSSSSADRNMATHPRCAAAALRRTYRNTPGCSTANARRTSLWRRQHRSVCRVRAHGAEWGWRWVPTDLMTNDAKPTDAAPKREAPGGVGAERTRAARPKSPICEP